MSGFSRRETLGLSSLGAGLVREERAVLREVHSSERQTLIYEIAAEPGSLDPATSLGGSEGYVMPAMFEGLVSQDPDTLEPRAALATHYEVDASLTEFTFFLRGHPNPTGTKLPGAGGSPNAALWSDGRPVIAHDFVHAWRRVVDPATAATSAAALYPVANGKEITEGKSAPGNIRSTAPSTTSLCVLC